VKVLIVHNQYRQNGGEDTAVDEETKMLRDRGVELRVIKVSNPPIGSRPLVEKLHLVYSTTWSSESYRKILGICREYRPDVAHVHNFWMVLSPSVHKACHDAGVATVQTLHNYRLLCLNGLMLRDGKICEDCLGRVPWRGVSRKCYRESAAASAAVASMIMFHRVRNTWFHDVDIFLTPSDYLKSKLASGKIPADRIKVKPNVISETAPPRLPPSHSDLVMYVGRLSAEKGVNILLSAWANIDLASRGRLLIIGEGPDSFKLRSFAESLGLREPEVMFTGAKPHDEVREIMLKCRMLILPSISHETFGNSVVEAFCAGRPVIVSDLGALADIVESGRTGYKVPPGNPEALADRITALLNNDTLVDNLGLQARTTYLSEYSVERNFNTLMDVYRQAIGRNSLP
jgi:glycosyltransferase involved in cell wall biosynthesis